MNKQTTLIMIINPFGIKATKILVSLMVFFTLVWAANAQPYQQFVNAQPSKTDVMSKADFDSRTGAATTGTTSMPTGNNESGLPFTTFNDAPDFYFIPADKRPRIMQQGNCGSCVGWATSTALASVLARQGKYPMFIPNLHMPDALQFYIMGGRFCTGGLNEGWFPPDAVTRMTQTGTFLSVVEPTIKGVVGGSFSSPIGDWWVKAGKSGEISNKDAMRKFIYTQGALVANFDVMYDFNRYTGGIYDHVEFVNKIIKPLKDDPITAPIAPITEETLNMRSGGHAVAVIGYFKGGKIKLRDYMKPIMPDAVFPDLEFTAPAFWIIQNSWGDKWGMNGIFYIAANQSYQTLWVDKKTNARTVKQANTIDDKMWYMLDPSITSKGKDIRN
jgi:hypothetical protein